MPKSFGDPIDRQTAACTTCPRLCRFSCPVSEAERRETVTPWGLMRLLELARQDVVALEPSVAKTFYHCTGCGRCQTWCVHEHDVPRAMARARAWAWEQGAAPAFAGRLAQHMERFGAPWRLPSLDELSDALEEAFDERAVVAFMPDCKTRRDHPELVLGAGLLLHRLLGHKVRLITRDASTSLRAQAPGCCGSPLAEVGATKAFEAHGRQLEEALDQVRELITDCASMVTACRPDRHVMARMSLPRVRVRHLIEVLAERVPLDPPLARLVTPGVMLHDSCHVGRHLELYEQTRQVAALLFERPPAELSQRRDQATCCGGSIVYALASPEGSHECAQELLAQVRREGGEALLCGQAGCKGALNLASEDVAIDLLEAACLAYELL